MLPTIVSPCDDKGAMDSSAEKKKIKKLPHFWSADGTTHLELIIDELLGPFRAMILRRCAV